MYGTVITKKYYGVAIRDFVVVSDGIQYKPRVLHDKDGEVKIDEYFNDSYNIFVKRLKEFKGSKRGLNASEEKEFRFMFESLISAKKFLHDKQRVS